MSILFCQLSAPIFLKKKRKLWIVFLCTRIRIFYSCKVRKERPGPAGPLQEIMMTIEQKVFRRMRFDTHKLEEYGFTDRDACYSISREFMGGDFTAEIMVYENGTVRGRVIDNMNDEEYVQLRMTNYQGAYVGTVREEYESLLRDIADKCCTEVSFASDQSNRIAQLILDRYGIEPDFPWDDDKYKPAGVFRHTGSRKWFGLIMNIDRRLLDKASDEEMIDVMNLKADENRIEEFIRDIPGLYPAYHMNHSKWISAALDDTMTDEAVAALVDESFRLTSSGTGVLNEKLVREVLEIADNIPPGRVVTYGQIAEMIGKPRNARLIGRIMSMADRYGEHPCHRVVNHAGRLVPGWEEQRGLLEAEGIEFLANGCVDMKKHNV